MNRQGAAQIVSDLKKYNQLDEDLKKLLAEREALEVKIGDAREAMSGNIARTYRAYHKHSEVIAAFANGETVEFKRLSDNKWERATAPQFSHHREYRIKPKPQEILVFKVHTDGSCHATVPEGSWYQTYKDSTIKMHGKPRRFVEVIE